MTLIVVLCFFTSGLALGLWIGYAKGKDLF